MSLFEFDHTYTHKISQQAYEAFEKLGFVVKRDAAFEHEGSQFCRFLKFNEKRYIEFIEVKDEGSYLRDVVEAGDVPAYSPGFSLRINQPMRSVFEACKEEFASFGVYYRHKNYRWKEDAESKLPGWNFLSFKKCLVPGIYIWVTEYEESERASVKGDLHQNTVTDIVGVYWVVESFSHLEAFEKLTSLERRGNYYDLSNGCGIYVSEQSEQHELVDYYKTNKSIAQKVVIVKASDHSRFQEVAGVSKTIDFFGKQAIVIETNSDAFDILVVG